MIQNQQIEYSSYMECQLCWLQPIFCTVLIERSGIQASQWIMSEWICFQTCKWFSENLDLIRFFPKLSFIIVSVLIYLLIDFGLFCLLVSTWGRHISEHYCLNQAWIKHTFTPTEGETHSKLQLFLFTSSVSIALYAFVRGKGCVCVEHRPSVGVDGCRKTLQLTIRCTMSDGQVCVCVCACVHVSCWCWFCGGFSDRT